MLIIQFIIIMSDSQLKKVIKKYKEKFQLNKTDFLQFINTRVEFQQDKLQQFTEIIEEQLTDEFQEDDLTKLMHLISAFQAGEDIKLMSDEELEKFTRIKFQEKKKRQKNIQKSQKKDIAQEKIGQKNQVTQKLIKVKNNIKQPQQVEVQINFSKNNQQANNMRLNIQQIDDDDEQTQIYLKLNEQKQSKIAEKRQVEQEERQALRQREREKERQRQRQQKRLQLQQIQRKKENQRREKQRQQQIRFQEEVRRKEQIRREQLILQQKRRKQLQKKQLKRQQILKQESRRQQQKKEELKKIQSLKEKQRLKIQQLRKEELIKQQQKKQRSEFQNEKIQKKSSNSSQPDKQKDVKKLNTIQEQKSDQISLSQSSQPNTEHNKRKSSNSLQVIEDQNNKQLVNITQFDKMGQDFMNPVIKYKIVYREKFVTWRRYSQIQKLMCHLRSKYQGVVLPQMPPKQGIKGNLSYFWRSAVNEQFLDERKEKLKSLLNRLLACQTVCQDQVLIQFLEKEDFQLPNFNQSSQSYLQTIYDFKNIVLNYNQIKDYGVAYYKYLSEHSNSQINSECSQNYQKAQNIVTSINVLNEYRMCMNQNFEKRRQIMYDSKMKPKGPVKTDFDKILEQLQTQSYQLSMQYGRYLQLKSTQSWQNELIKQKTSMGGQSLQKIKENHAKTVSRISKTQKNLLSSINKFTEHCQKTFKTLVQKMKEWRKKAHP